MAKFIKISYPKNLVVENNYLNHTNGIYVHSFTGAGTSEETIRIRYNSYVNLDGRQTTDSSFSNDFALMDVAGDANLKIVQFDKVYNIENCEISWNQVINVPFYSAMQDEINIYNSSGTSSSPIKIHNNYIQGAYSADPVFDQNDGVGILCDGSSTAPSNEATAYIDIYSNQVIANSNVGIAIAAGHNNNMYNNRVVSAGFLPDGQWIKAQNVGMYIRNHYNTNYFASSNAWGNLSGCNRKDSNGSIFNNPYWFPDAGTNTANNSSIQGQITIATEQAEYQLWLSKLYTNQITIGSNNMPQLGQTGKVIIKETYGYDDNTKLNTTTTSGNWTTGWVQNPTVASPTPLPDTYVVSPTWQVNLNDMEMYRGTSQIAINGEYDYFFRWEQSLNSSNLSPSIGADLRLVAYDTNINTTFGMKSLSGTSQGQYIPFFMLQGGDNNNGNSNIILNNGTQYTIVGRLSSRNNGSGVYSATGKMMAYESGVAQPGNWMTETYSASGISDWQFQAVGFCARTYDTSGSAIFKGLTVEKYTKAEIEPIETAVNLAVSTKLSEDIIAAQTLVEKLIDGIAKDTFTAKLNALTNNLYIGKPIFFKDEYLEEDVINVNTIISNYDTIHRKVVVILALYSTFPPKKRDCTLIN